MRGEGDVDILKDFLWRDTQKTIAPLHEVVAPVSRVLTPKLVSKGQAASELLCFDEEASAIGDPWVHFMPTWVEFDCR